MSEKKQAGGGDSRAAGVNKAISAAAEHGAKIAQKQAVEEMKERLEHYRAKSSVLENQIRAYQKTRGKLSEYAARVAEAVKAAEPFKRAERADEDGTKKIGSAIHSVQMLSDLHIGESISSEETEGFGGFSWKKAQTRMGTLAVKHLEWIEMHRHVFSIPVLHVFGLGDYISGNIHKELEVTNEFPLPVQTANAGLLIGETVAKLASGFDRVVFWEQGADNHSRLNPKPQAKQKQTNSMSYLVHVIMESYLREHGNVEFKRTEAMKMIADVNGKNFLLEHGDTIRGQMGIPYYGFERNKGREAVRRMGTSKHFDYIAIGHWHVPALISGNIYVNGSLSGTTEFDHSQGRHADPAQVSFLVHPNHGIFDMTSWRLK